MSSTMTIKWYGHSCMAVTADDYTIIFDPYEDGSVPGLKPLRVTADKVLCSHGHADHNAAACVTIDPAASGKICPFTIEKIDSYHDENGGRQRGGNTIHILEAAGLRVAHMGDIGCEPTPEQKARLKNLDVMMVPVGGYFTLEPKQIKQLTDELAPTIVIPMHYRGQGFGYDQIGDLAAYTSMCDDVIQYDSDTLTVQKPLKNQTAVLKFAR